MNLNGKTIILTGGSSGIGEQAAIQLASLGAKVCIVARRSDELARVQNTIQQQGGQAWIYPVDITKDDDAQQCIEKILSEHKTVDVLINNAAKDPKVKKDIESSPFKIVLVPLSFSFQNSTSTLTAPFLFFFQMLNEIN